MSVKLSKERVKKKFSFPLYLIMYFIALLIGFVEAGLGGLAIGLASALLCSLITIVALVPFVGIPLYLILGGWLNGILGNLGVSAPVAQAFSLYGFLIFAGIVNVFISLVVFLLILKAILG